LTPFRECGSAVLFEDVATVEVAVVVEVVVDRGVGGGKLLESFHVPELRHGIVRANSFTLPKRQNRILRSLIFRHFSGSI
jgi:hypothetical protein